jgi:23S rRNA pseudouridine2605 synthase
LFALNKPVDVICTTRDHENRRTIFELDALQDPALPRLMNVGRLDINSEGLLLMSSDGPLAQALMSPDMEMPRIYRVRVRGRLKPEDIEALREGVEIDGMFYRGAYFEEEGVEDFRANSWYRVELYEGKNREIRRLMSHYGCSVNRLIRVSYGPIHLGELKVGEMREVPAAVVRELIDELRHRGATL